MKLIYAVLITIFASNLGYAQLPLPIFKDRKIINSYSTETLPKSMLDFRVGHRFGDMFGDDGGWPTFYGLENARDISIGFDYGISDHLLVGINRTKGAGPLRMLVNSYIKYKIAGQDNTSETPLAVSVVAMNSLSTMPRSDEVSAINNFPKFAHRLTYHFQMMVSKRFSEVVSLQFNVGYTHRNFVDLDDVNYLVHIGGAGRFQLNRRLALLIDGNLPTRFRDIDNKYTAPLGIGMEWETGGGHVFQINFTNSGGLSEPDYLSYTTSQWADGQFRLGFTIARQFKI
ncbi:MAG: hypothetical protein IPL46_11880 [Saprospiraceae bacterium]|nr:hypothetical protein [Saprospiraceae bacterium]